MRKRLIGRKLLVASIGVGTISYVVGCGGGVDSPPLGPDGNLLSDVYLPDHFNGGPDGNLGDAALFDASDAATVDAPDAPEGG